MSNHSLLRITKEITSLQKGSDLSLAVNFNEDNVRQCRAIIVGPPETPYEFGFFEFSIQFGRDYPQNPPAVRGLTTNGGQTRFNPNIYADGKVCLSILGTWRAEPSEEWSSAQGLESILISIQSLMSSNPYENEPGFEKCKRESDKTDAQSYISKIRHETLRVAVASKLEQWLHLEGPLRKEGEDSEERVEVLGAETEDDETTWFADLCKRRFMWYYHAYLNSIDEELKKEDVKDGAKFRNMPFEHDHNDMKGTYDYTALRKRLQTIRAAIDGETDRWEAQGLEALRSESPTALSFQNRFKHLKERYSSNSDTPVDFELVEDNPFAWRLILFGRPMSNLDGGIFKIKIVIPLDFPREQPRVHVETPLFHQRVSPEGVLCYFPTNGLEIESHVAAIIEAIEEEQAPYDPRTLVNPEAAKLLWGSADEKKLYNRKLRRSAQDSSEAA